MKKNETKKQVNKNEVSVGKKVVYEMVGGYN